MFSASSRSRGLPSTSPSTTTVVSAPSTGRAAARRASPARAFSSAMRETYNSGASSLLRDSTTGAIITSKRTPICSSISRRRGEAEARLIDVDGALTSSRPVIGMPLQYGPGAIQLFGRDDAYQHVRQGQRRQRPLQVRARAAALGETIGPAHQQGDVAPVLHPGRQLQREHLGGPALTIHLERDHEAVLRYGGELALALLRDRPRDVRALGAPPRRDLDQMQAALRRQTSRKLAMPRHHPLRHTIADSDQMYPHPLPPSRLDRRACTHG